MNGNFTTDPELANKLVKLFSRAPTPDLIGDLNVALESYRIGDITVPLSISDPPNGAICCPSIALRDHIAERARRLEQDASPKRMVKTTPRLLRATGLDRQVQFNNWLFPLNPVPTITPLAAQKIRDDLTKAHPKRAIVIRSLIETTDADSIEALKSAGFIALPGPQVYIAGTTNKPTGNLPNEAYEYIDAHSFSADDFTRAAMLYHMLHANKDEAAYPRYTPGYLAQAHQIGLLKITGLRGPDGQLDGVIGLFENDKTLTTPIIGYTADTGLCDMLAAIALRRAETAGKFYCTGSANRVALPDAQPVTEYMAVYVRHLGLRQRMATKMVAKLLNQISMQANPKSAP